MCARRRHAGVGEEVGAFRRVQEVEPGSPDAAVGLGWVSLMSGDLGRAAETWRPVVGHVTDPTTLDRMVEVYARVGDRENSDLALRRLREVRSPK